MLLPAAFLFDIESDDLLRDIGRWVLREACRQGRSWQDQRPDRPLMMAVNLSSSQIRDPHLVRDVSAVLVDTGFDPALLRLEISESITLDEIDAALPLVRGLKDLGVGLALDDFGAGNSGWTLLRQSQIDVIKLDQSFIAVGERELPENIRMIEALSGFADRLGMAVAIEGVERADQAAAMRNVGVQQAQGFYFGCPQPPAKVAPWLAEIPLRPIA
jgi:EAL domain-containing protein (putative c-di-GMP-specific phosphodiesterase class I)